MAEPASGDPRVGEEVEVLTGSITITWTDVGSVTVRGSQFAYNDIPSEPGVYRIRVNLDGTQQHSYIGHSVNVRRRVQEDVRERTDVVLGALNGGDNVRIDLAEATWSTGDGPHRPVMRDREFARLFAEGAALAFDSAELGILNRARRRP